MNKLTAPQKWALHMALEHPERRIMADDRVARSLIAKGYAYSLYAQGGDHSYGFAGGYFLYDDIGIEAREERLRDA